MKQSTTVHRDTGELPDTALQSPQTDSKVVDEANLGLDSRTGPVNSEMNLIQVDNPVNSKNDTTDIMSPVKASKSML